LIIETGVLHAVGLRNTLEPDPDNTGVGSFRGLTAFFLDSQREFSCFRLLKTRGVYVLFRCGCFGKQSFSLILERQARVCSAPRLSGDGVDALLPVGSPCRLFAKCNASTRGTGSR
jgi:hypothetical protein